MNIFSKNPGKQKVSKQQANTITQISLQFPDFFCQHQFEFPCDLAIFFKSGKTKSVKTANVNVTSISRFFWAIVCNSLSFWRFTSLIFTGTPTREIHSPLFCHFVLLSHHWRLNLWHDSRTAQHGLYHRYISIGTLCWSFLITSNLHRRTWPFQAGSIYAVQNKWVSTSK